MSDGIRIDDRFRTFPSKGVGYAGCPTCLEPLIATMRWKGAEFICMTCRTGYGFMAPVPIVDTVAVVARHQRLKQLFDAGVEPGSVKVATDTTAHPYTDEANAGCCNQCGKDQADAVHDDPRAGEDSADV